MSAGGEGSGKPNSLWATALLAGGATVAVAAAAWAASTYLRPNNSTPSSSAAAASASAAPTKGFAAVPIEDELSRADCVVTQVNIYPIKSCKGVSLQEREFDAFGFEYDRHWLLATQRANGQWAMTSQRQNPRLALVVPSFTETHLQVEAPGKDPLEIPLSREDEDLKQRQEVRVWGGVYPAIDEGDEAAAWFSDYLNLGNEDGSLTEVRLFRMPQDHARLVEEEYRVEGACNTASFADGYPFLLISEASLEELNFRIRQQQQQNEGIEGEEGEVVLPMWRFRPNIVVRTVGERQKPFVEDEWFKIQIGEDETEADDGEVFYVVKACTRCKLTTVDHERGEFAGPEPLQTLGTFRLDQQKQPMFGQNLLQKNRRGRVRVGDRVQVLELKTDRRKKEKEEEEETDVTSASSS
ncbi:MOSC domain-containing protein [Balamuthia mandrillaris]